MIIYELGLDEKQCTKTNVKYHNKLKGREVLKCFSNFAILLTVFLLITLALGNVDEM